MRRTTPLQAASSDTSSHAPTPGWPNGFDDRWYIAPTVGGYYNDTDRNTNSRQFYYGLGVGKFIQPNVSIDLFVDRTKRKDRQPLCSVRATILVQQQLRRSRSLLSSVTGTPWRPYLLAGVMGSYHHNPLDSGWDPAVELALVVSKTITDSADFRVEAGYRYDWDDKTLPQRQRLRRLVPGLEHRFALWRSAGCPAAAVAPPPPAAPDCSKQFRNGVNLCDNKCPDLPEGTIVGPDGCPQKVVIDLRV
jgi:OOP family OmpA-OmpF porin